MVAVIVSLEGVNLSSGLIVREMSLYFTHDRSYRHYFFKVPRNLDLTHGDRQTDKYYRNILGGIGLNRQIPGSLDHRCVAELLHSLQSYSIYTCGNVSFQYLQEIIPHAKLTDIQTISSFSYPSVLVKETGCGIEHPPRYCALAKLLLVKDYCYKHFN